MNKVNAQRTVVVMIFRLHLKFWIKSLLMEVKIAQYFIANYTCIPIRLNCTLCLKPNRKS